MILHKVTFYNEHMSADIVFGLDGTIYEGNLLNSVRETFFFLNIIYEQISPLNIRGKGNVNY